MHNKTKNIKDGDRPFPPKGHADETDGLIGEKIRLRRGRLGFSQAKLGEAIGITFQQIQKYERGINRVSASTLIDIAEALDVDIGYFYDGLLSDVPTLHGGGQKAYGGSGKKMSTPQDSETEDLLSLFQSIDNSKHRRQLLELARSFSESSNDKKKLDKDA